MTSLKKFLSLFTALFAICFAGQTQVCIPTYSTICFSPFTEDLIDNFWTVGGITDITNMDTDCSMLPDNYWYTGMAVTACAGETIETNVQCEVDAYIQGFAIWIDWNQDDVFDLAEKEYASPTAGDAVWTGSFTVPLWAVTGDVFNMRVRSKFASGGAGINPCDVQVYGETEDYLVIIGSCDPTICEGDTVTIDLGTMPPGVMAYSWDPAVDISDPFGGPTVDVWPSDSTTYTCTITSVDSTWDVPINVNVIHSANPDAGLDDTICHDMAVPYPFDASVDVDEASLVIDWEMEEFTGPGSPLVAYSPSDNVVDASSQVSIPGLYEYVLYTTDSYGFCPDQSDTVLILFSKAEHETIKIDPICFGYSDGSITVTGTGTLPTIEYSIDGGATWQVSNEFLGLPAGIYTVTSIDEFGCEFSSDVELIAPTEISVIVSPDTLVCVNGTASLSATGVGGGPYTYTWSEAGMDDGPNQTFDPTVSPTIITVIATSPSGCFSSPGSIEITIKDPITLTITANDSICPTFGSGAMVIPAGGDGAYTYTWTENGVDMADVANEIVTSPAINTTYCVTVDDGCETTPVTICTQTIMRPVPAPIFTSDITAGCDPSTVNFITIIDPTDVAIWTIDDVTYTDMDAVAHEFSEVGFYDITLEVTNQYGCVNSITASDYMEVVDIPYPDFYINPNPTTIFNTTVRFTPAVEGSGNTFEWSMPGATPSTSTDESPIVFYPEGIPDDYEVELTVTNEYGCFNSVLHTVNILTDVIIYAPNVFTPDGDEFNEGWRVYIDGIDFYDYHCTVFNRWGEIVWESFDATGVWTGTYGGEFAQEGTYVWVVQAKESTTDKKVEFKGTVSILR